MQKDSHHLPTDPVYDNPDADRFATPKPKREDGFSRVAYVLHGGGALGAYQMGVMKALHEAGYEPDWIAATSIGAIQGGILTGNTPENKIPKLEEFWHRVSSHTPMDIWGHNDVTSDMYHDWSAKLSASIGQKGFFRPRWCSPYIQVAGTPDKLSIYDMEPLRKTLLELIDFDILNRSETRLSLGAVQVSNGLLRYFNNIHYKIGPEHIMASAALPPGFPAVKINNEYYWDGGIHSNTPLEVIFDAIPRADTLCFVIDCFGGSPFIPTNMSGVAERVKDINYSTHAQRVIQHHIERFYLKSELKKLTQTLNAEQLKEIEDVLVVCGGITPCHITVVHITYSARVHRGVAKDYDFGRVTIQKRADVGYRDARSALAEASQWNRPTADLKLRVYEAPNNLSRLLD